MSVSVLASPTLQQLELTHDRTLSLADRNKLLTHTGDTTLHLTLPDINYPIGSTFLFINKGTQAITITTHSGDKTVNPSASLIIIKERSGLAFFESGGIAPVPDTIPPTATNLDPITDIVLTGDKILTIRINYQDNVGVPQASIKTGNISIFKGSTKIGDPTFVSVSGTQKNRIATYTYTLTGLTLNDNGTYDVKINANQVKDHSNNFVVAATLDTFDISIPDPPTIPSKPVVTSPSANTLTATIQAVVGATSYVWQHSFNGSVFGNDQITTDPTITINNMIPGNYIIRVKARNTSGDSVYGTGSDAFTVTPPSTSGLLAAITVSSPANNAIIQET